MDCLLLRTFSWSGVDELRDIHVALVLNGHEGPLSWRHYRVSLAKPSRGVLLHYCSTAVSHVWSTCSTSWSGPRSNRAPVAVSWYIFPFHFGNAASLLLFSHQESLMVISKRHCTSPATTFIMSWKCPFTEQMLVCLVGSFCTRFKNTVLDFYWQTAKYGCIIIT